MVVTTLKGGIYKTRWVVNKAGLTGNLDEQRQQQIVDSLHEELLPFWAEIRRQLLHYTSRWCCEELIQCDNQLTVSLHKLLHTRVPESSAALTGSLWTKHTQKHMRTSLLQLWCLLSKINDDKTTISIYQTRSILPPARPAKSRVGSPSECCRGL